MQQIQGIPSKRTCTAVDHGQKEISYICTYEQCDQNSRWLCAQCILMKFHNHNQSDQVYLQDQKQFMAHLEQKSSNIQNNNEQLSKKIIEITEQLRNLMAELNSLIKNLQIKISNNDLASKQINDVMSKVKQDLFQLTNNEVNLAIETNYNPNEINEYIQLNQFAKDCRFRFETFQRKNQRSQDLFGQRNVNQQKTQVTIVKDSEQIKQVGQQNKQQVQNNRQGSISIAQGSDAKSPINQSRIRYELPQQQMQNSTKANSQIAQNQYQSISNQQAQSQIRYFQPQDQIINEKYKSPQNIVKVQGQPSPAPIQNQNYNQNQQNTPFVNNNNQNQQQSAVCFKPFQRPQDPYSSPQRLQQPNNFGQQIQQQISQIKPNQMDYFQLYKK